MSSSSSEGRRERECERGGEGTPIDYTTSCFSVRAHLFVSVKFCE